MAPFVAQQALRGDGVEALPALVVSLMRPGRVGRELYPLSHLVHTMRRPARTSEFMQSLGPFFVGHVLWRGSRS